MTWELNYLNYNKKAVELCCNVRIRTLAFSVQIPTQTTFSVKQEALTPLPPLIRIILTTTIFTVIVLTISRFVFTTRHFDKIATRELWTPLTTAASIINGFQARFTKAIVAFCAFYLFCFVLVAMKILATTTNKVVCDIVNVLFCEYTSTRSTNIDHSFCTSFFACLLQFLFF